MIYYYSFTILFILGLCGVLFNTNLIKKVISLSIMQTSIILFFIIIGKNHYGHIPILKCLEYQTCPQIYANPLPQVLMLTAIVVGVATLSVALALIIRIKEAHGIIEETPLEDIVTK